MSNFKFSLFLLPLALFAAGCGINVFRSEPPAARQPDTAAVQAQTMPQAGTAPQPEAEPANKELSVKTVDFSRFNSNYRFFASVPAAYQVEYVAEIESINIYDPAAAGTDARNKSQIFIRYFQASDFLTLSTVNILNRQTDTVQGHAAVRYEIKKKPDAANFAHQPIWRNNQHKLVDARYSKTNPSLFFVFSYNPELPEADFNKFIAGLVFHNDAKSLHWPMDNALARVTKKPFGINVSPANSPVLPERFSGYHNAVDFEILAGEETAVVPVFAVCGGKLLRKQMAGGYGGVMVQECSINDEPVTVIYGHIQLNSVKQAAGNYLAPGEQIAVLGEGFSQDTDGARKHLHLGIHKGRAIDIRGYLKEEQELTSWINFLKLIAAP